MEFESPDVEKDFPGLYASESGRRSNESDFSDDAHDRPTKKDLLIGKRKDKKDSKKDRGYAALEGESSPEEDAETKSPSKSKKSKSFKFPSTGKKEKREKSREKDGKEKDKESDKDKKKEKEGKVKFKLKERKKSKHGEDFGELAEEQPVFGVPLELALDRSRCHDGVDLPLVVRDCIDCLQDHGLNVDGLYKMAGVKTKVQQLRRLYNQRETVHLSDYEPPTVTSLLKQFLRELPEPLLTSELLVRFEEAAAAREMSTREADLGFLVEQLPPGNRLLLAWILTHLNSVTAHEKQNKMNAQSLAAILSPVLQMSHRLLTALLCHCTTLFPDVQLHRYIPPLPSGSPSLPDTVPSIAEELRKQESLLNQIHREMNAGFVSKQKEEQLWEVQRIITQLKRKLRTVQKVQQTQNQKSLEENEKQGSVEEEFRIDTTLQKARSCSEDDTVTPTEDAQRLPAMPPSKDAVDGVQDKDRSPLSQEPPTPIPVQPIRGAVTVVQPIREPSGAMAQPVRELAGVAQPIREPAIVKPVRELGVVVQPIREAVTVQPIRALETLETDDPEEVGLIEEQNSGETEEELQGLLQEETALQLEHRELLSLQADLQGRVREERAEIERLRAELATAHTKYNYRSFTEDSSENSSSASEQSDGEGSRMTELRQENQMLKQRKTTLVRRIMEEREACLHLRVQLSLLQLSHESKQL